MKFAAYFALACAAVLTTGCASRRCDTWSGVDCRTQGGPAGESPLRVYAFGNAGLSSPERQTSLALLAKVIASEPGPSERVLTVLGDNVYERGPLSTEQELADAKAFYEKLFGAIGWKAVAVVPGNHDHGAWRHGGFDAAAVNAQQKWFKQIREDLAFPPAADPRTESPWLTVQVPGLESCLALHAVDSQGYRENLLAAPVKAADAAWNLVLAHHPTRPAANHMGDRYREEYLTYASAMDGTDLLVAANDNVLFADLEAKDATHPGPPNIVSGAFAKAARVKSPEFTRCASELPGFVRLSVEGDALVADFFSSRPGDTLAEKPYCSQRIEKAGAGNKCGLVAAKAEAKSEPAATTKSEPSAEAK